MTCRLCKEDKPLKDSHIIPKFAYKATNDSKNRSLIVYQDSISEWIQSGVKTPLLCGDCEERLCSYEKELSVFLKMLQEKDPRYFSEIQDGKNSVLSASGFDFDKIKKAIISIVWRLSQVDAKSPLKKNYLGPYEAIFEEICKKDSPLQVKSFPIYAQKVVHEGNFIDGIIANYDLEYVGVLGVRKILLDGVLFRLFLSKEGEKLPSEYEPLFLGGTTSAVTFVSLEDIVAQTSPLLKPEKMKEVTKNFLGEK